MEIIILVALWYVTSWLSKHRVNINNGLHYQQKHFIQSIWGLLSNTVVGVTIGYTIWFVLELGVRIIKLYA